MNHFDDKQPELADTDTDLLCQGIGIAQLGPDGRYIAAVCGTTSTHSAHWLDGRDYFNVPTGEE